MRHTSAITVLILSLTMWLLGMPLDSHAKPKSRSFGCTVSDLQTNFASSCIHQADQDIMQGHSYIHVVVCEGGNRSAARSVTRVRSSIVAGRLDPRSCKARSIKRLCLVVGRREQMRRMSRRRSRHG